MEMKVSDYIVDFFIDKGVTDVFGYPGGMVTNLMESFSKKAKKITAHVNYHEQASAFCACGYAQVSGKPGVAYATSGPGATNLITGICNAYFDSIPTIFITGQVNTNESRGELRVRQRGFQETDIVSMVKSVTKYSVYISDENAVRYELEKAWHIACTGRKGPVLLDIPMNIQKSIIDINRLRGYEPDNSLTDDINGQIEKVYDILANSKRPVLLVGAGVKLTGQMPLLEQLITRWKIPVVSSMLAFDVMPRNSENFYGFIGAYGDRTANFVVAKSDLIISLGSRLDVRQVGANREKFAENACVVRVEIDEGEMTNKVHEDELQIRCDVGYFIKAILDFPDISISSNWISICNVIKEKLAGWDVKEPNYYIKSLSEKIPEGVVITTDVGQNQVWIAQSYQLKNEQKVLFSGGHGAMGYSLPAAIGAYYGSRKPIVCFNGDGGIQMNIQELQFVAREKLPVTIVIMNNNALGMIRHFQEMYFDSNYFQTMESGGYTVPDFKKIAYAYGIGYYLISSTEDMERYEYQPYSTQIVEIKLSNPTYVFPKLRFGTPNQDQEPLIDRTLYQELMEL